MPTKTTALRKPARKVTSSRVRRVARRRAAVPAKGPARGIKGLLSRALSALPSVEAPARFPGIPHFSASAGRARFSEMCNRAAYAEESTAIESRGKVMGVFVPPRVYELICRVVEDLLDGELGTAALKHFIDSGERAIPEEEVAKRLGIKI